jgi:hypothetical protein
MVKKKAITNWTTLQIYALRSVRKAINGTNQDGGVNAGQLLDIVEESAVIIARIVR